MQYVITAYDFTDDDALARRMANREAHLAGVKKLIAQGHFLSGGAILDDEGRMVGSTVHVAFESRAALDEWIDQDPYTLGRVWETFDIREVRLVPVDA
ncbi:YciI family protein [Halomonas sp. PAMB 3232]|uniref:YciI family protein n=1 Tax=Halomonas sp. PAMB 3232 TaxID=3075221 RepID=UPI00289B1B30|nr:YciI family protein [Halomonas sp. PAMB 3232]WNL39247.1 YciI family protein [Halomonas sp. PAMB 3232]